MEYKKISKVIYNELSTYKKNRLNKFIEGKLGLNDIGVGSFATVYKFGRNNVIRIEKGHNGVHSGYKDWVEKIVLSSKSKHVPKIFFHGYTRDNRMITVVEKLENWEDSYIYSEYIQCVLCSYSSTIPDMPKVKLKIGNLKSLMKAADKRGLLLDDVASSNVMLRKSDKRLIITDPLY